MNDIQMPVEEEKVLVQIKIPRSLRDQISAAMRAENAEHQKNKRPSSATWTNLLIEAGRSYLKGTKR